jgi:hypothetical protein
MSKHCLLELHLKRLYICIILILQKINYLSYDVGQLAMCPE